MNRKFLVPAIVLVLFVIIGLSFLVNQQKRTGGAKTNGSISATSKQKSNTPPPTQSVSGPSQPDFFGFDEILNTGVTDNQISALKFAFSKYAKTLDSGLEKVTVSNAVTAPHQAQSNAPDVTNFDVQIDGQSGYTASITSSDLTSITLQLKNPQGTVIFDSGLIDLYKGIGN